MHQHRLMREEIEQLKDIIELLKQEIILLRDKYEDDYLLINDRLDEMAVKYGTESSE